MSLSDVLGRRSRLNVTISEGGNNDVRYQTHLSCLRQDTVPIVEVQQVRQGSLLAVQELGGAVQRFSQRDEEL